jgi:hypothetical protein
MNLYKIHYGFFSNKIEKVYYFKSNWAKDKIEEYGYYWHGLQENSEDAYTIDIDRNINFGSYNVDNSRAYLAKQDILQHLRNEKINQIIT